MSVLFGSINPGDNPTYPPKINKYILVQKQYPDGPIYIGKVIKILENNIGTIIKLLNGQTYQNDEVKQYIKGSSNPYEYMLVLKSNGYRYTSEDKIKLLENESSISQLNMTQELIYDTINSHSSSIKNKYYSTAEDEPNINVPLTKLINVQDMDEFVFISQDESNYDNKDELKKELKINETIKTFPIEDNISSKLKSWRSDIINKLENDKDNKPNDILIVDQMMITKYIDNHDTLKKEADKIKKYLLESLGLIGEKQEDNYDKLFGSIRFVYYNGYIHIFRTEIPLKDTITHELLEDTVENPKIKLLGPNEYDIPIRHNTLKYILFQNETQKSIYVDQRLLSEAELILSQEYIISLTPEPRYQLWTVLRLIKLWYGDIDLQNNIKKIKFIINQYRTRSDKKYNIKNGIRFSIGIYPRYGKKSATIVLKKIMYYFAIYFQAIGWKNNPPSYFKIVNDLIAYTNCDQSMKLYYRRMIEENKQKNTTFSNNYTLINKSGYNTDILEQYISL